MRVFDLQFDIFYPQTNLTVIQMFNNLTNLTDFHINLWQVCALN